MMPAPNVDARTIVETPDLEYRGVTVLTASLSDVARSKEAAGRPKDLLTLPAIRAHIERMEELDPG